MKNLPVSYCTGSLSDMILTSDRQASKQQRTSTTTVLWDFTTGKLWLIKVSTLCQVLTSYFISEIFSGEGMHVNSFADERMPDLMWLSWASAIFVCWLCSALLDALLGYWLEVGLWLIGKNVGDKISGWGVKWELVKFFLNPSDTCLRWWSNMLNTSNDGLNGAIIW